MKKKSRKPEDAARSAMPFPIRAVFRRPRIIFRLSLTLSISAAAAAGIYFCTPRPDRPHNVPQQAVAIGNNHRVNQNGTYFEFRREPQSPAPSPVSEPPPAGFPNLRNLLPKNDRLALAAGHGNRVNQGGIYIEYHAETPLFRPVSASLIEIQQNGVVRKTFEAWKLLRGRSAAQPEEEVCSYEQAVADLQQLAGFLCDRPEIGDYEFNRLFTWFVRHRASRSHWPVSRLASLLEERVKNERAAPDWEERLTGFLSSIRSDRRVAGLVFDTLTREQLSGRRTMLTGRLTRQIVRRELYRLMEQAGVIPHKSNKMSGVVEILVVGDHGSPAWRFGNYGRKIETAVELREKSGTPRIVRETDFFRVLDELIRERRHSSLPLFMLRKDAEAGL